MEKILELNHIDNKVLSGPFKGIYYSERQSHGSVWLAKLLGIYENELHSTIDEIINDRSERYETIIDIGSAEGFYILGLASKIKKEINYIAYEAESDRRNVCKKLIEENKISVPISLKGRCTFSDLSDNLNPYISGLLLIDCEGCELELLNRELISRLKKYDLIIEVHELNKWKNSTSSEELFSLFSNSHKLKFINIKKYKRTENLNTDGIPDYVVQDLLNEGRDVSVGWIYAKSREAI